MAYQFPSDGGGDGGDGNDVELTKFGSTRPTITAPNQNIEIQPVVTNERGILNWNTETDVTTAGETIVDTNGDMNWRPVLEGILIQSQFEEMVKLRNQANEVRIITDAITTEIVPDRFEYERVGEEDVGEVTYDGQPHEGPIYTFQLQVKEEQDSGSDSGISSVFE